MLDALTRLAVIHGTDKFGYHDYTPNYHALLGHLRDRPVRLLEIGVGGYQDADRGGESLEMWRDYFARGQITGIDIREKEMDLGARVAIEQGSQVDAAFLAGLVRARGPFDVIIDDGSHRNEHVVMSFEMLFPTLAPGGIHVIEDMQTAFFPRFGGSLDLRPPNSVGHVRDLFRRMPDDIARISRFHNMVALFKAGQPAPPALAGAVTSIGADTPIDGLIDRFTALGQGDVLEITGFDAAGAELQTFVERLFVEIDHREIAIHFPEAPITPLAERLMALHRQGDRVFLVKGDNTYPSNFALAFDHPRVRANLAAMKDLLMREGRERGLLQLADLMSRAGDDDTADLLLARAMEIGASSRSFFNAAIRRRRLKQDWQGARALLDRAIALYPDDPRILGQLGGAMIKAGDWSGALDVLGKAVERAPHDVLTRIQYANALARVDRPDEAIAQARKAVEMAPDHDGHKMQLARLLIIGGKAGEAVPILREVLERAPDNAVAARHLSRAYEALGQRDQAIEAVERALALAPENAEYRRWRERLIRG